ncbi:MAG: signal peptidase I [Candidatus Izemoplasma sp.]
MEEYDGVETVEDEIYENNIFPISKLLRKSIIGLAVVDIVFLASKFSTQKDFNPAIPGEIYDVKSFYDFGIILRENFIFFLFIISAITIISFLIFAVYMKLGNKELSSKLAKSIKNTYEIVQIVPYFVLIVTIINMTVFSLSTIEGRSMEPNYYQDENTIIYHFIETYDRFDVVIIKVPDEGYWIKRIIGLPGETVVIDHNKIYINGDLLEQEFLEDEYGSMVNYTYCYGDNSEYCTFTVEENTYFVLGDNRPVSNDSRRDDLGLVDASQLYGKVVYKYEGLIFNIFNR